MTKIKQYKTATTKTNLLKIRVNIKIVISIIMVNCSINIIVISSNYATIYRMYNRSRKFLKMKKKKDWSN